MRTLILPHRQWLFAALLVLTASCTINPLKQADTPQDEVWAVLKVYHNILKTQVLPAMKDTRIPESIRRKLGDLNRQGTPAAKATAQALGEYFQVKAEVAAGVGSEEKLTIALENLGSHLSDVKRIVADFKDGLEGAQP